MCWPTSRPRATTWTRLVAGLTPRSSGDSRPPPPGWDIATQIAHLAWTDEAALRRGHRHGRLGRAGAGGPRRPRAASSTMPPWPGEPLPDRRLLTRWRAGARGAGRALRSHPTDAADAVVRPAHVGHLHGHGALHGDLGALPGRARRPRAPPPTRPTGSGTWPIWACAPAASPYGVRGLEPPVGRSESSSTAPSGGRLDVGSAGRRPAGDRAGVRLLPAGHPARAPRRHRPGGRRGRRRPMARHRPVLRRPVGEGRAPRDDTASDRQLLGLLRRPALGDARDGGGRSTRRAHRRLPGRADHADPGQGPAEGRARWATPAPSSASSRSPWAWRWSAGSGSSPTPAGSTRRGWPTECVRSPTGSASTRSVAHVEGDDVRGLGLPGALTANAYLGGLRHRCRAHATAPTSSSPAGSPTPRWWSGRPIAHFGWDPTAYDAPGRRHRGRAHPRVRHAGHRR